MQDESNVGRPDPKLGGERSTATGEVRPPDRAIIDEDARLGQPNDRQQMPRDRAADRRHEASADEGQEGTANTSPEGGKPQRKPNA